MTVTTGTANGSAENARLCVRVELGHRMASAGEVSQIVPGSVIELDAGATDEVNVLVAGHIVARGHAVVVIAGGQNAAQDRLGVRVRQVVQGGLARLARPSRGAGARPAAKGLAKAVGSAVLLAAVLLAPARAFGQTSPLPTDATANQLVQGATGANRVGGAGDSAWLQTVQTLGALAVVVGLILACRFVLRRLGKGRGAAAEAGVMEVLAKTAVAPKQQLLLVRLGGRLVLVGTWPGGMTRLSEITDAAEVAALMGAAQTVGETMLKNIFRSAGGAPAARGQAPGLQLRGRKAPIATGPDDAPDAGVLSGAGASAGMLVDKIRRRLGRQQTI